VIREDLEVNHMSRMITVLLLCLGLPALAAGETPTWEQHPSKNKPRKHVMVQFSDMSLHPSIAQVVEGGTVSWVNYASMYEGSIVFSDEVATAFTCSDLRPNWMKTGTGYQSIPITMGGAANDLEIPCALKPGEYEYEIWLFTAGRMGAGFGGMDNPQSRMQGKIIVE
jgi:plastocyanin